MTNVTVTVVGLGAMGLPMATNLARTFHVRGVDVQEARLELGREAGLEVHTDAPEAARGADVVLLAVRNQHQLEAALFGEKGVADELAAAAEQTYLHGLTLGLGAADDSSVIRTVTPEDPAGEGNSERSDG